MTTALSTPPAGTGRDPMSMGSPAGLAPPKAQITEMKIKRNIAFGIWMIPLALLLTAGYLRLSTSALLLHLGLFGWIVPAALVAILGAILWALVVFPNSRGNTLGSDLRAGQAVDAVAVAKDQKLVDEGRQLHTHGDLLVEDAAAQRMEAEERITEAIEITKRSLLVAAATFGLHDSPNVRPENLVRPTMPHLNRITAKIVEQHTTKASLATQLGITHLPAMEALPSPHIPLLSTPEIPPGVEHVDPRMIPTYPQSTLTGIGGNHNQTESGPTARRRLWKLAAITGVTTLLIALAIWLFIGHGASALASGTNPTQTTETVPTTSLRTAAHPAPPVGLKEGVDYSFTEHATDGAVARWDCNTPITVRLAGPAPSGAAPLLESTVASLRNATNLPLQVGTPLPQPVPNEASAPTDQIVVNYLTAKQIADAHLDLAGDTLGLGGAQYDTGTGKIIAGWVAIRTDTPITDPSSKTGAQVTWHEMGHALNLGHSQQTTTQTEIMAPDIQPDAPLAWGPGDHYALGAVGCTA